MRRVILLNKVPTDLLTQKEFIEKLVGWSGKKLKKRVVYTNIHGVVVAMTDKKFLRAVSEADLVYPDGWGPVLAAKIADGIKAQRVNGADFIDEFLEIASKKKMGLFLLGDEQHVLDKAVTEIKRQFTGIKVVGFNNGFFKDKENGQIIQKIKTSEPALVLVGMGSPKQEVWLRDNWDKLPSAVYWCVGGLFHYIAKNRSRAPMWMRNTSLEWFYRLLQEPKRLLYRYTIENILFIYHLTLFLIKKKSDSLTG